jgi:chromosome segregation ATPase
MSTLEDGARTALERLTALDEALGSAEDAVTAAERQAEETEDALDPAWSALTRAAETLLEGIAREAEAGEAAAQELDERLSAAAQALEEVEDRAEDALEDIAQGFAAMGERADELREAADARLTELRARAQQLEDRAQRVSGEIRGLLGEATALFEGELRPELARLRADVEERAEELEDFVRQECLAPLGRECDSFCVQVERHQGEIEQAVRDMIERTGESLRGALAECRQQFEAEIDDLLEACGQTARAVAEAAESLREGAQEVGGRTSIAAELHDEHARGFDGIRETLDHVRETFGRFSFLT